MAQARALGWGGGEEYKSGSGMYLGIRLPLDKKWGLKYNQIKKLVLQIVQFAALFHGISSEL